MKSEITQTEPTKVFHKRNAKEKSPSKEVLLWRGLDKNTYKYILTNRYYDDTILVLNHLDFMIDMRRVKFPKTTMSVEKVRELKTVMNVATA